MCNEKYLIVNADDFGLSPSVNEGIIEAHQRGIVTSASLMVRWPAAADAAQCAREHCELSLGLHLDLGEWAYRDETWMPVYEVARLDDVAALAGEISQQLSAFREIVGKDPTHIDSHQHVHLDEPVRSLLIELANKLGVPVRQCSAGILYCGSFYGQTSEGLPVPEVISVEGFIRILAELRPGFNEVGCHPGKDDDLDSMYRKERRKEVEVLTDPRLRAAILASGFELCSFASVSAARVTNT